MRNDAPPGAGVARGVRNDDLAALRAGVPAAQAPPAGGVPGRRPGRAGRPNIGTNGAGVRST